MLVRTPCCHAVGVSCESRSVVEHIVKVLLVRERLNVNEDAGQKDGLGCVCVTPEHVDRVVDLRHALVQLEHFHEVLDTKAEVCENNLCQKLVFQTACRFQQLEGHNDGGVLAQRSAPLGLVGGHSARHETLSAPTSTWHVAPAVNNAVKEERVDVIAGEVVSSALVR
jgi:hypothetical protein